MSSRRMIGVQRSAKISHATATGQNWPNPPFMAQRLDPGRAPGKFSFCTGWRNPGGASLRIPLHRKMKMRGAMQAIRAFLAAVALGGFGSPAFGQQAVPATSYPSRPVRIVIPLGPGSSVEIVTRLVTQKLTAALGRPFVVESQPGASSQIGIEHVAKSPADGYTLLCSNDNIVSLPSLKKNVSFSIQRDFLPITEIAGFPMVLIEHPSVPAKNVAELVSLAKAQPGKLDYTSGGVGSIQHIAMELFEQATGTR